MESVLRLGLRCMISGHCHDIVFLMVLILSSINWRFEDHVATFGFLIPERLSRGGIAIATPGANTSPDIHSNSDMMLTLSLPFFAPVGTLPPHPNPNHDPWSSSAC